jgi:hypothetical protein
MMRDAAIRADLVGKVSVRDHDWRDRLRIITYDPSYPCFHPKSYQSLSFSEPEAAAVHCAYLTDLHKLTPSQVFMICDAGGGTVVRLGLLLDDLWCL